MKLTITIDLDIASFVKNPCFEAHRLTQKIYGALLGLTPDSEHKTKRIEIS